MLVSCITQGKVSDHTTNTMILLRDDLTYTLSRGYLYWLEAKAKANKATQGLITRPIWTYLIINHKVLCFYSFASKHFNKFTTITGLKFFYHEQWFLKDFLVPLHCLSSFVSFPLCLIRRQWQSISILSLIRM